MPRPEELTEEAEEHREAALNYIADAEFREEEAVRSLRFLQATAHLMLAVYNQNKVVIGLLREAQDLEAWTD
ncbi:MAG: hypothetical protein R6V05_13430 [Candidatus Brocadiia bacterium]